MASIKLERPLPPTPPLSDDEQSPRLFCHLPDVLSKLSNPQLRYERKMGDTELSYFLPSRQSGVNDMCVRFIVSSRISSLQWSVLSSEGIFIWDSVLLSNSSGVLELQQYGLYCASDTRCSQQPSRCTTMMMFDSCKRLSATSLTSSIHADRHKDIPHQQMLTMLLPTRTQTWNTEIIPRMVRAVALERVPFIDDFGSQF